MKLEDAIHLRWDHATLTYYGTTREGQDIRIPVEEMRQEEKRLRPYWEMYTVEYWERKKGRERR